MPRALALIYYVAGILFCLTPWASPGIALGLGLVFALVGDNPYRDASTRYVKWLLQASVVLLGFGVDLAAVLRVGAHGILFAAVSIFATFTLGYWLARLLRINLKTSLLISAGTAICGGSAIAAVGSAVDADKSEMSVAMGTVFVLNAVALYLFPPMGHWLGLSQGQFGTWAGIAIHDVSSVAGAASAYGDDALRTATIVKLSRVLWIVPVTLIAIMLFPHPEHPGKRSLALPWFILGFLLASGIGSFLPALQPWTPLIARIAKAGFAITLFCIGAGLSRAAIRQVGYRPLVQGVCLWAFISCAALLTVVDLGR